jgi:hypothetical protein
MKDQLIREGMKNAMVVPFDKLTGKPYKKAQDSKITKNTEPIRDQKTDVTSVEKAADSGEVENLVFKVQIGSFKNDLRSTAFRKAYIKISKLMKIDRYTDSKNNFIYTVGSLKIYQEACSLKDLMVSEGIKDAFVAAFLKGERIKVNEAIKIAGGK